MKKAWLGLGSNVGDRLENLRGAVARLDALDAVQVEACSSVYETEPIGEVADQRDFLNAAVRVVTSLAPLELLDACKAIERGMGRVAGPRHGPRPIDVDVLLIDGVEFEDQRLRLPHPEVTSRRFVLVPLLEVDPPDRQALERALSDLRVGQRVSRFGIIAPCS